MIAALGFGLWSGTRLWTGRSAMTSALLVLLAGVSAGLSILSKFNGFLGLIIIICWSGLAVLTPRLPAIRKVAIAASGLAIAVIAIAVFVVLNPALTARPTRGLSPEARVLSNHGPWERFREMVKLRLKTSKNRAAAVFMLSNYPLLFPLLEAVPHEERVGAIVKGEHGLPVRERSYRKWFSRHRPSSRDTGFGLVNGFPRWRRHRGG